MNDPRSLIPSVDALVGSAADVAGALVPSDSSDATAPADTVAARPVPVRLDRAPARGRPGRTPPGRRLIGVLDRPMVEGDYDVRVTSVVNINGLGGGGGDVVLRYEPPPPPPADTLTADDDEPADVDALPDTAVVPDSLGLFP